MFSYCHTAATDSDAPPNPNVKTSGPVREVNRLRPPSAPAPPP